MVPESPPLTSYQGTIDSAEVARFAAVAAEWWNPDGKFRPLHRLNPVRLTFIRDQICSHFGRDSRARQPLSGLRLLDIGCGGGLIAEPMARLGAVVLGADAAETNISVAQLHAAQQGLTIAYRHAAAEDLVAEGARFEVILALEIVEHVASLPAFLDACAAMLEPNGLLVVATLNRSLRSLAFAIVGAEYVLRWLPRGTHQWSKLVRPEELARALAVAGLDLRSGTGFRYNPLTERWSLSNDRSVNYAVTAVKSRLAPNAGLPDSWPVRAR